MINRKYSLLKLIFDIQDYVLIVINIMIIQYYNEHSP